MVCMGLSAMRVENVWQCVIRNFDGRRGDSLSSYRGKRAESVTTADGEEPATMAAPEPSTLTADTHEYSLPFWENVSYGLLKDVSTLFIAVKWALPLLGVGIALGLWQY